MKKILLILLVVLFAQDIAAQNYKFGKVSKEELEEKYYPLDSSANAVVLYKKRRTYFEYNNQTGWELNTKVHERIKIYNKEGYLWASKRIKLYTGDVDERVIIKAYSYNIDQNKIKKTKLKSNDIYVEKINKYWEAKKFTMPNLKEGTVIEWEYSIRSPYFSRIDDMIVQYDIPIKLINSKVEIPEYFIFKNVSQGFLPLNITKSKKASYITIASKSRSGTHTVKTTFSQSKINFDLNITTCEKRNVPALMNEAYVNNINNYRSLLKFELTATKFPNSIPKTYNTTWEDVVETIYKSENFGGQIKKTAHLKDDLAGVTGTDSEKMNKIYELVKTKIKWNGFRGKYTTSGVRKAYKDGVGNVAEVNLNLVGMLREAGFNANPVLVSTRDNGVPIFPTNDGFNYVIVGVESGQKIILLDATEKNAVPNILPLRVMNWKGRLIRKNGTSEWVNLISNKYSIENSTIHLKIDNEGDVEGMSRVQYSNFRALTYRNSHEDLSDEKIIQNIEEENNGIEISDFKMGNKTTLNKPAVEMFKFSSEDLIDVIGDKMFFKPLLFKSLTQVPFKLEKRLYPIDFGTPLAFQNVLNITIPEGYNVESQPESINLSMPNGEGTFILNLSTTGKTISITSIFKINSTIFPAGKYEDFKKFYKSIVMKNLEQIVLKKV